MLIMWFFCMHLAAIVDNKLYIDGGFFWYRNQTEQNNVGPSAYTYIFFQLVMFLLFHLAGADGWGFP